MLENRPLFFCGSTLILPRSFTFYSNKTPFPLFACISGRKGGDIPFISRFLLEISNIISINIYWYSFFIFHFGRKLCY